MWTTALKSVEWSKDSHTSTKMPRWHQSRSVTLATTMWFQTGELSLSSGKYAQAQLACTVKNVAAWDPGDTVLQHG